MVPRVRVKRKFVSLPKTKNGKARQIRLNAVALTALKLQQKRSLNGEGAVFVNIEEKALQ
jgi:hypothetical protein